MLTSRFGDLEFSKDPGGNADDGSSGADADAAPAPAHESAAAPIARPGFTANPLSGELLVDGSAVQALRDHWASTEARLDRTASMITMFDPDGVWATAVIKALSLAAGRPIERLQLRERTTLRELAVIECTTLERRHEDTLRICHASVPSSRSRMLMRNRMTYLLSEIDRKKAVIFAGICVSAMM